MIDDITITFTHNELTPIIADFFGYEESDVDINDYSDEEIKRIILEKAW